MRRILLALVALMLLIGTPARAHGGGGDYRDPSDDYAPGLIDIKTWFTPQPTHTVGNAVWYGPFVMEGTARWRGLDLSKFVDGVSLLSPADIGETVWLRRPGYSWEGPFLDVDCAMRGDMWPIIAWRGEVVEVGFRTALRWGMVSGSTQSYKVNQWRLENVEVWIGSHPPFFPTLPVNYHDWFLKRATFATHYEQNPLFLPPYSWRFPDGIMSYWDFHNEPPRPYFLLFVLP